MKNPSQTKGEILLALIILTRSISFVFTKIGLREMEPFTLLGMRFLTAFLFLLLFTHARMRHISITTIRRAMILGGAFFAVMAVETSALQTTNASTVAFLENTAIVYVPIFEALLRKRFSKLPVVVSTLLSLCGVALLTLKEGAVFTLSAGEGFALLAAILYACAIIITSRISRQDDPLTLGILQVGFMGLFNIVTAFLLETPKLPEIPQTWGVLLFLAIVCSGFGFTLQPLAQSKISAERAGLFCAISPAGAALFGRIILGEKLGTAGVFGIVLILCGMLFSNMHQLLQNYKGRKA